MIIDLNKAVCLLQAGDVVAVPTETVYGLAARFDDADAVAKVFALKNRPNDHPLIVHIADSAWLYDLAVELPDYLPALLQRFWPGPLTVVLKKKPVVSDVITAGQDTVAVRFPRHPVLQTLLETLQVPVVAPSANKFCQTSPTSAQHVLQGLGADVPVLDGGVCQVGIESSIILATEPDQITLLRPGILAHTELEEVAGVPCIVAGKHAVKVAGSHKEHYKPAKPLFVTQQILNAANSMAEETEQVCCMLLSDVDLPAHILRVQMPNDPAAYAKLLYHYWQSEPMQAVDKIVIELPQDAPEWFGVRDRILKAACGEY